MTKPFAIADRSQARRDSVRVRRATIPPGGDAGTLVDASAAAVDAAAVLDASAAALMVHDHDGVCLYANRPALRLLGGSDLGELIGGMALAELEEDIEAATLKGEETHRPQLAVRRLDGQGEAWVESWVRPSARGAVVTLYDVSARRAADAESAFRKILLQAQSDASLDGILVVSPRSEFISFNRRFVELWGVPADIASSRSDDAALGWVISKLADPQGFIAKVKYLYEHPEEESRDEFLLIDGRTFDSYSAPVRDGNGSYYGRVWFFRDVTQRRRVEAEREELLAREQGARLLAEEANRAKDEFLAVVSHELRTPLTAVLGWARLLRRPGRSEADRDRALAVIERNAMVQVKLIEDLLDVSRVITGKIRLNVGPVELDSVIACAVESVQPAAAAKGIQIETHGQGAAALATGDAERLQQVVFNLLSNAIKFTEQGGTVSVRLERTDSAMAIAVTDDGIGIAAEFLPHVFERFRQADARPTTRAHGGLGLGLAIVRHLVELHGGSASAYSEGKGKGARFVVSLPVRALRTEPPSSSPRTKPTTVSRRGRNMPDLEGLRVLYVDDQCDARELLADLLGGCGARVTTASSAEEARALMLVARPHVLVSDISMPGEDGYSLIEKVRAAEAAFAIARLPALALTAMVSDAARERAAEAGFDAHVAKPAEPIQVARAVASLAGRRGEQR